MKLGLATMTKNQNSHFRNHTTSYMTNHKMIEY